MDSVNRATQDPDLGSASDGVPPDERPRVPKAAPGLTKEQVFERLVEEILTQRLRPGEALAERQLAERFGLSRTPIREVLLRLQGEHLVDIYPNQGAFVRRLAPKDVRDLFQLRSALEPFASELAAKLRPDDEVAAMLRYFSDDAPVHELAPERLTDLGEALHDAIAGWTMNDLFADMYGILRKRTRLVRSMTRTRAEIEIESFAEHRTILRAIADRDGDEAREAMRRHLKRTHEVVMRLLLEY